ncbi:MBOAT family protein [uncultured Clostridium sp.]|uniref:MBOAT family O-acyltransferase n=1 Tax=uncultured Clostridium sp. TaxID=59620 RepID=UPI002597B772|nr:MBOAT family O-acyltransferase [uncultured Clostridium sp.]
MSITSYIFWFFLAISTLVYYIVPRKMQWIILLITSALFFFMSCKPYTGVYLLITIIATHICANRIAFEKKKDRAKRWLIVGIVIDAGLLIVLKYSNFAIENTNIVCEIFGIHRQIEHLNWIAPLGISYYTMQVIAYLVDVYGEISKPERSLFKTALFVGYYPQLTSGPIAKFSEMGSQLYEEHRFDVDAIAYGVQRILWGVFKKLVISARLGIIVDTIYGDTVTYSGFYIWIAAAAFLVQLYTDFSGCMDIVIGASECYGIILPENFRTPFFAKSVQEFWQRWHITLGGWLRDYIMYPVLRSNIMRNFTKKMKGKYGKKCASEISTYIAMLIVWLMFGLWHGGAWKFILGEGMMCYMCILLGKVFEPSMKKALELLKIRTECFSWRLFQMLRTFVLMAIANMFFRLNTFGETILTIRRGLNIWNPWIFFDGSLYQLGLNEKNYKCLMLSLVVLLIKDTLECNSDKDIRKIIADNNILFRWIIWLTLLFSILIFGMYGSEYNAASFIYGNF